MKLKSLKEIKKITKTFTEDNLFNFKNVFQYFGKIFILWFAIKIIILFLILASLSVTKNFNIILSLGILGTFTSSFWVASLKTLNEYPKLLKCGKLFIEKKPNEKRKRVVSVKKINKKHYENKKNINPNLELDLNFLENIKDLYLNLDPNENDYNLIRNNMQKLATLYKSYPSFYNKELIIEETDEIIADLKSILEKYNCNSLNRKRY